MIKIQFYLFFNAKLGKFKFSIKMTFRHFNAKLGKFKFSIKMTFRHFNAKLDNSVDLRTAYNVPDGLYKFQDSYTTN